MTGNWEIPNVPDGEYTVLVAWENDGLVLDPDTAIGGGTLVKVFVSGADKDAGSFKLTGALDVESPPDGATASLPVTFVWSDDSSEDHYEVEVFGQSGNLVYNNLLVPPVSGQPNVTHTYGGSPLSSGETYQFVAYAVSSASSRITRTENLRGVFIAP